MNQRIAVYCGSKKGRKVAYESAAKQLGAVLVDAKIELVFGGARVGLMGVVADAVINQGGRVTGVIPHGLDTKEVVHQNLTELVNVSGMHERKAKMLDLADAFIALPGGIGTMDEFFEILTLVQTRKVPRFPLICFGRSYWSGLLKWANGTLKRGKYISPEDTDLVTITDSPAKAMKIINDFHAKTGDQTTPPSAFA